jgi:hypothetical protein
VVNATRQADEGGRKKKRVSVIREREREREQNPYKVLIPSH